MSPAHTVDLARDNPFTPALAPYGPGYFAPPGSLALQSLQQQLLEYKQKVAKRYRFAGVHELARMLPDGKLLISPKIDGELWFAAKIGGVTALVAPNVIRRIDDARITKAKQDIRAYETALNLYRMDNFRYPTTDQGLDALVKQPADPNIRNWKQGGYIQNMRKDPWGNDYNYISPGSHGEYDLFTLGADGQAGGEGSDADIGNWNIE